MTQLQEWTIPNDTAQLWTTEAKREDMSVKATWGFETTQNRSQYLAWAKRSLKEFDHVKEDYFRRHFEGDQHTLTLQTETHHKVLKVTVRWMAYPD